MASCKPNDQVLLALLKAAERIGAASRREYMAQVKRDRRGRLTRGYTLNENHQRLMTTIDNYARCRIDSNEAMSVLHEYGVLKARTKR